MTASPLDLKIGGRWFSSMVSWFGQSVITHRRMVGCWALDTKIGLDPGSRSRPVPKVGRGERVEAWWGPTLVWAGTVASFDPDEGTLTARGLGRQAETAPALSATGTTTSTPRVAVAQAIARGDLGWSTHNLGVLPNTPFAATEETDRLNRVGDLLDAWASDNKLRWWVDQHGVFRAAPDPTTPSWYITPATGRLGLADDEWVTHYYGRFQPEPGVWATATRSRPVSSVERAPLPVDLTGRGYMTLAQANTVLDGLLEKSAARMGWTTGLELTPVRITTPGGVVPGLGRVVAGQMGRLMAVPDERGLLTSTDIVMDESIWRVDENGIFLAPVGLAARDLTQVLEQVGAVAS